MYNDGEAWRYQVTMLTVCDVSCHVNYSKREEGFGWMDTHISK